MGIVAMVIAPYRRDSYNQRMTEAIAFDTQRFVKHLTEKGFTEMQAEALAEEHVALLNANLATKADMDALRQEIKADMDALRQETKAEIARAEARIETAKSDLLKWLLSAMIAQGGLIVALVKLL